MRFFDSVVNACAVLAGLLLLAQVAAVCADVFMRYAFNAPIAGINALTEWSLVYVAFLGAAWLQREKGHVSVDMIHLLVPRWLSIGLFVFALAVGLVVTAVIMTFGIRVTWIKLIEREYDFFKLSWMPIWVIYVVMPFGAALWMVQLIRDLANALKNPGSATFQDGARE